MRFRGGTVAASIWLAFILFPLADAIAGGGSTLGHALTIAAAAVFVAAYVTLVASWRHRPWHHRQMGLAVAMVAMAIALTLGSGPGWGFLFTYCAAVIAMLFASDIAWLGVIGCAALAAGCSAIAGASGGSVITYAVTALGIGLLMVLMRDLRVRNEELVAARAELARVAVAQERERFARDLHDLLGHTLSVITLKAELAGRLLPGQPEPAAREVHEIEQVAREALSEVRDAVSGYRQPTLDRELAGARMALSAAGIEAQIKHSEPTLTPDVEAVLAWAVREGATNVIRHSGASHCTIRVLAGLSEASVEVTDSGTLGLGEAVAGNGLAGLRERAQALGGSVAAGALPEGGFRLRVVVPARPGEPVATLASPPESGACEPASSGSRGSGSASPASGPASPGSLGSGVSGPASPGSQVSGPASPVTR
jgi:two-component system sensor histidine kinase DesK